MFRRDRLEAALAEEMATHRALAERDAILDGATRNDAQLAARRQFGSAALASNRARDVWIATWLQDLAQDLHFGVRLLRKEPAFTAAVVLVLGIGIGVNTTQFTIVDGTCIRGLPVARPDRVVYVRARDAHDRQVRMSYHDFEDLRSATRAFSGVAAFSAAPMVIADDTFAPDRVLGVRQSAAAFRLLGIAPMRGRDFTARDEVAGAPPVALISNALWADRYASDPAVIGRTVRIDGTPSTIIGIMPAGFRFPSNADVWEPLATVPGLLAQKRDARTFGVFGRMVDAAALSEARAEVAALGARLGRDYPDSNRDVRFEALPINDQFNANIHDPAWKAFITVGFLVLMLASANAANLLLMRAVARSREIAVRASLGASRFRIVRQLLVESSVLAALGAAAGLVLARIGVRLFESAIPADAMPFYMTYTLDGRIVAMLVGGSAATVLVFGLAPAIHLARGPGTGTSAGLRSGGTGLKAARWMTVFLASEFALAIIMLALVAMSVVQAVKAQRNEVRLETANRLTGAVTLPTLRYPNAERRRAFYRELIDHLVASRQVERVALATALPLAGAIDRPVTVERRSATNGDRTPLIDTVAVTSDYFGTLGVPLRRGRAFDRGDCEAGHEAAIVNQRFVEAYLPDVDPIGQRLRIADEAGRPHSYVVVGVSAAVRQRTAGWQPSPVVYLPVDVVAPTTAWLLVQTRGNPADAAPLLRARLKALDSDLPLYRVRALDDALGDASWNPRLSRNLLWALTIIALGLCVVGLYAVTAHGVARRAQEIGVRIALGARTSDVIGLVLLRAARQVAYGFAAGFACTLLWTRLFYEDTARTGGSTPMSAMVWIAVAGVLAVLTIVATVVPARRALTIDPAVTLRSE